jgi:hypothetical protein
MLALVIVPRFQQIPGRSGRAKAVRAIAALTSHASGERGALLSAVELLPANR